MRKVEITTPGIVKALRRYDYKQAISEYVWNGFDAKASEVQIWFHSNEIGNISEVRIVDNGYGIPKEELKVKFLPFFESEKEIDPNLRRNTSAVHGKNGVGRLTFFHFASAATWQTIYETDGEKYEYEIYVDSENLNIYDSSEISPTHSSTTGTEVTFTGIHTITAHNFESDIAEFLMKEFGWFLELNSAKSYSLKLNGVPLDYSSMKGDEDSFVFNPNGTTFDIRYIRWEERQNREYSRYYFIGSDDEERGKKTTTLNNKGDHFYHSVYIKSSYFDNLANIGWTEEEIKDEYQGSFFDIKTDSIFKDLMEVVDLFLKEKRRPFLRAYTDHLISDFRSNGAFPKFGQTEWDKIRRKQLEDVIREMYQIEPRIFSRLNTEQKKIFTHFLNLIIDDGEMDRLLDILGEVVDLRPEDRGDLAEILKTSRLSNIIKTIQLIEDRYTTIEQLKALVFNPELKANERDHIQKFVEKHYWIFGEQYHLVTAAEPKFEEALRRYVHYLRDEVSEVQIDHPDKYKEMDIFMVRWDVRDDIISNVVAELKHPRIHLGKKQLDQVHTYMGVILKQEKFNAPNMFWEFYLVGKRFDQSGYIEGQLENAQAHGEKSLVFKTSRYKIYIKKWSEIFTEFEIRHNFLNQQLKLQREKLIVEGDNADEIVELANQNSAIQPPEMSSPTDL
jgi:hypothetical protein